MPNIKLDRRAAVSIFAGAAWAVGMETAPLLARTRPISPARRLFRRGSLAGNPIAADFIEFRPTEQIPATPLIGADGAHTFGELKGKVHFVTLWADWCAPCLGEAHDLAELARRHAGPKFRLLAIAQKSGLDYPAARTLLDRVGAESLPTWVERTGTIGKVVAHDPEYPTEGFSMPCNLLVDRHGRVRGRSFSSHLLSKVQTNPDGTLTNQGHDQLMHTKTSWSLPEADAFIAALIDGVLDHV